MKKGCAGVVQVVSPGQLLFNKQVMPSIEDDLLQRKLPAFVLRGRNALPNRAQTTPSCDQTCALSWRSPLSISNTIALICSSLITRSSSDRRGMPPSSTIISRSRGGSNASCGHTSISAFRPEPTDATHAQSASNGRITCGRTPNRAHIRVKDEHFFPILRALSYVRLILAESNLPVSTSNVGDFLNRLTRGMAAELLGVESGSPACRENAGYSRPVGPPGYRAPPRDDGLQRACRRALRHPQDAGGRFPGCLSGTRPRSFKRNSDLFLNFARRWTDGHRRKLLKQVAERLRIDASGILPCRGSFGGVAALVKSNPKVEIGHRRSWFEADRFPVGGNRRRVFLLVRMRQPKDRVRFPVFWGETRWPAEIAVTASFTRPALSRNAARFVFRTG